MIEQERRRVGSADRYYYDRRAAEVRAQLANAQALTFDLRTDPPPDALTLRRRLAQIEAYQRAAQQAAQEL